MESNTQSPGGSKQVASNTVLKPTHRSKQAFRSAEPTLRFPGSRRIGGTMGVIARFTMFTMIALVAMAGFLANCSPELESNGKKSKKETQKSSQNLKESTPLGSPSPSPSNVPTFATPQEEWNFLQGKYEPSPLLSSFKNPGDTREHYLLPIVLENYRKMIQAFEEDRKTQRPDDKTVVFVVSSFRNFSQQKSIWEGKFSGQRKMREPIAGKSPEQIVQLILEFSSAPGTSRHHWGTDLDINALENSYFEKGGKGEYLYQWLRTNAYKYGFCQPYNALENRGGVGYQEEKWHWSYKPVSSELRRRWIQAYNEGMIRVDGYKGAETLGRSALDYVSSVAEECR